MLLEEGVCYDQCILLAKLLAFAVLQFVHQGQTEIRWIIFFAAENGEALYSQQKQDLELAVAQFFRSLLKNSGSNRRR